MGWRTGFSLAELLLVVVLLGMLAAIMVPKVYQITTRAKVNETAKTVANDLEQAVGLAGRLRKPVQLAYLSGGVYTVRDRATSPADTLRLTRNLGLTGYQGVGTMTFSTSPLTIYPNGLVSSSLTVTVTSSGYSRTVTLSPAGMVREQ